MGNNLFSKFVNQLIGSRASSDPILRLSHIRLILDHCSVEISHPYC